MVSPSPMPLPLARTLVVVEGGEDDAAPSSTHTLAHTLATHWVADLEEDEEEEEKAEGSGAARARGNTEDVELEVGGEEEEGSSNEAWRTAKIPPTPPALSNVKSGVGSLRRCSRGEVGWGRGANSRSAWEGEWLETLGQWAKEAMAAVAVAPIPGLALPLPLP